MRKGVDGAGSKVKGGLCVCSDLRKSEVFAPFLHVLARGERSFLTNAAA